MSGDDGAPRGGAGGGHGGAGHDRSGRDQNGAGNGGQGPQHQGAPGQEPHGQGPEGPGPPGQASPGRDSGEAGSESAIDRAAQMTDYDVSEWLSLEPGEEVVWVGEPTKLRMVGTAVTGVLLIPFLIGILVLLFLPLTYLGIKHTDYVVTNRSLYVKKGILSTNVESIDLDRIQNTEFTQSFWGKQLGFGTIEISTAGSSGADISFAGVEDARAVRDEVTRVQREFAEGGERGARDGTGGGGRARTPAADARVDELVGELRATREALERVAAKLEDSDEGGGEWGDRGGGDRTDRGSEDPAERETDLDPSVTDRDDG